MVVRNRFGAGWGTNGWRDGRDQRRGEARRMQVGQVNDKGRGEWLISDQKRVSVR